MNEVQGESLPQGELAKDNQPPKGVLDDFLNHLGRSKSSNQGRLAQSIITRSEAELFGISIPRFAVRHRLDDGGIVNCRRLDVFQTLVTHQWSGRRSVELLWPKLRNGDILQEIEADQLVEAVRDQEPIADCILSAPTSGRYRVFKYIGAHQENLLELYGEDVQVSAGLFLPFVRSFNLGGGLCGQAVTFMAAALLSKYAKQLHGIAEITAYSYREDLGELPLSGLSTSAMGKYLDRVGLRSHVQSPRPEIFSIPTPGSNRQFGSACRSYLASGIPVILPVDINRISGYPTLSESVYGINGYSIKEESLSGEGEPHMIVLVGYSEDAARFVCHDPGAYPFMRAPLDNLVNSGIVRDSDGKRCRDSSAIIAVTPSVVRMPLLFGRATQAIESDDEILVTPGLFSISDAIHRLLTNVVPPQYSICGRRFILSQNVIAASELNEIGGDHEKFIQEVAALLLESQAAGTAPQNGWLWYEILPNSIWLWNAEESPKESIPRTDSDISPYLIGVVARIAGVVEGYSIEVSA